jgi:hypothetical protein
MSIEDLLITEFKEYITDDNLHGLKQLWEEYQDIDFGKEIAWDYVFQKVYLHAALKKRKAICEWLDVLFELFDPIIQISLRQMFSYARYLLRK